jgi:hypothetical protein
LYDNILETLKLQDKATILEAENSMDQNLNRFQQLQEYSEVCGISQLNEEDTLKFMQKYRLKEMPIFIPEENQLRHFDKFYRFEMIITDNKVFFI